MEGLLPSSSSPKPRLLQGFWRNNAARSLLHSVSNYGDEFFRARDGLRSFRLSRSDCESAVDPSADRIHLQEIHLILVIPTRSAAQAEEPSLFDVRCPKSERGRGGTLCSLIPNLVQLTMPDQFDTMIYINPGGLASFVLARKTHFTQSRP